MASDSTESLTREEAKRILRRLELDAYAGIVTAFRAQGDLDRSKKQALQDLATRLSISNERHRAEVRRAVNDDQLNAIAECIHGPSSGTSWSIEGRRLISMMPRLVPQTALSAKATASANTIQAENSKYRRRLATSSAEANLKLKTPLPNGTPGTPSPLKSPVQKMDIFNNNVNAGPRGEPLKLSDMKSSDPDKSRKKKRHVNVNKLQAPKLSPSLLTNKAIPKSANEGFKPSPLLPSSISPSKTPPGYAKFHSKPIILQRSSPFKSSHHSDTNHSSIPSITTSSTGLSTPTIPVSTFSMPTRPTITSFTTSPSGGLIPVQYSSTSSISSGMSPSKVKFKAPMPRQRGKPSKFKTIGPSPRSISLPTASIGSEPMNVLATPTGIPITPISPNKTQTSPVPSIPTLPQSNPCTVKVVQIPKATATTTATTPPLANIGARITSTAVSSTPTTKTPAQRVLTFSNLPGHSGQQLKIASIPNVLQQSGALASSAKLVSISKSVPMATGFKMIAVTTMVPGSSQVKTVYIATPIMSLTKSVTHGTGSIISTSVHNRKRTPSSSSAVVGVSTMAPFSSSTDAAQSKTSSAGVATTTNVSTSICSSPSNLAAALSSKAISSILSVSSQGNKEKDLLVISPIGGNTNKGNTANDDNVKDNSLTNSISVCLLSTTTTTATTSDSSSPPSILAKQIKDTITTDRCSSNDKEILSAGDAFIANLAAKFSKTASSDAVSDTPLPVTSAVTSTANVNETDLSATTPRPLSSSSSDRDKEVTPIDLSAKETLDGEDSGTFGSTLGTSCINNLSSRTASSKNSVMFLSSEDGIWSGSDTLCKSVSSPFVGKKVQPELLNSGPKPSGLTVKSTSSSNCIVTKTTTEASNSPAICRCRTGATNSLTISSKDIIISTGQPSSSLPNAKPLVTSTTDNHSLSPPDKKKPKLVHVSTVKGDKLNFDVKSCTGIKNCQKFELVGGERKTFNKFIPIQNQHKEASPGPSKVDSSHYTSTLRDLNKLFFNQSDINFSERRRPSDSDGKSSTDNGPLNNDGCHQDSGMKNSSKAIVSPRQGDANTTSESPPINTTTYENDLNQDSDDRLKFYVNIHDSSGHVSNQTSKKRKMDSKDPNQRYQAGWVRSAQLLLQRVSRYRGSNKQKGEMNASSWFARPVDPDDAPGYYKIIKSPMDFSTIKGKLEDGSYHDYTEFFADMQLIKKNCHTYNPPEHPARKDCDDVFSFFEVEYKKTLERWQRCHVSPTKKLKGASNTLAEEVSSKT